MVYLMKCGHTSNAKDNNGNPVCVICGCKDVEKETEGSDGLEEREAECCYCGKTVKSSYTLAFFEHRKDKPKDEFYCGCRGWD